jgi:outer membrane protease
MKTYFTVAVFLTALFASVGNTFGGIDWGINFSTQRMTGHTTFDIEVTGYDTSLWSDVKIESELEFPLDVFLVGGGLSVDGEFKTGEPWGVNMGVYMNINDPSGYMKDSDWIGLPEYGIREKFSFTESDAELKAFFIYMEGHFGVVNKSKFSLELLGGYEYQDFSFEIFGVRGWKISEEGTEHFEILQGTNVLDYDISYHIFYAGVAATGHISPRLQVGARGAYSPHVKVNDHDDHLLRNKSFDGDCTGWALKGGGDIRWTMFKTSKQSSLFLGLGIDYMKIDADGDQVQYWYGDDPGTTEDDETGLRLPGIKENIKCEQTKIKAHVGYQF